MEAAPHAIDSDAMPIDEVPTLEESSATRQGTKGRPPPLRSPSPLRWAPLSPERVRVRRTASRGGTLKNVLEQRGASCDEVASSPSPSPPQVPQMPGRKILSSQLRWTLQHADRTLPKVSGTVNDEDVTWLKAEVMQLVKAGEATREEVAALKATNLEETAVLKAEIKLVRGKVAALKAANLEATDALNVANIKEMINARYLEEMTALKAEVTSLKDSMRVKEEVTAINVTLKASDGVVHDASAVVG